MSWTTYVHVSCDSWLIYKHFFITSTPSLHLAWAVKRQKFVLPHSAPLRKRAPSTFVRPKIVRKFSNCENWFLWLLFDPNLSENFRIAKTGFFDLCSTQICPKIFELFFCSSTHTNRIFAKTVSDRWHAPGKTELRHSLNEKQYLGTGQKRRRLCS
jgi:hypothetical protein